MFVLEFNYKKNMLTNISRRMILEHINKAIPRACYTLIVFTLIKTSIWANN